MQPLLTKLRAGFPGLKFSAGQQFCWSPESNEVFYKKAARDQTSAWSLLHETGHALLGHQSYKADFELVQMEVAAWQKARELAADPALGLDIQIDEDHIQDCLDTYRNWLYRRSICPNCQTKCLQQTDCRLYRCFNCHATWKVSANRFSRAYRSRTNINSRLA